MSEISYTKADARGAFENAIYPDRKNQDWRFSSREFWSEDAVGKFINYGGVCDASRFEAERMAILVSKYEAGLGSCVIYVKDGKVSLPEGRQTCAFQIADFAKFQDESLKSSFYKNAAQSGKFGALFASENLDSSNNAAISVAAGAHAVLEIVEEASGGGVQSFGCIIDVGRYSSLRINLISAVSNCTFYLKNTFIRLQEGAKVEFNKYNLSSPDSLRYEIFDSAIAQDASLSNVLVEGGAGRTRNETKLHLSGKGANAGFIGLLNCRDSNVHDLRTWQLHESAGANSLLRVKNIIDDRARAAFIGEIIVGRDAQQTKAYQHCRTLQLSKDAEVAASPILEIQANDVECSHGCAVAEPSKEEIFYMRARGLNEKDSRKLLISGFAESAISEIPDEKFAEFIRESLHTF